MAKERVTNKKIETAKAIVTDPFAEVVEPQAVETAAATPAKAKRPRARTVPKPAIAVPASDAFAEIAETSSPVKKRKPATKKADSASAVAEAVPSKPKATRKKAAKPKKADLDVTTELADAEPEVELSPVFKALADVTLPELQQDNRARLLMQSPTKLYFYWSLKDNPWHQLKGIFGDDLGSYTLVLKLTDLKRDSEEIHPCEAEGNWWFTVEPDGEYQAEIGFYAVNRPYFRVIYSNTITTPRRSPSPHPASEARWTVSATKFAEVLDVSGFARDAFDVAIAGDDPVTADNASHIAFSRFIGSSEYALDGIAADDIRYAMLALASGFTLEELRWRVGPALFAILQTNIEKLTAAKAQSALKEYFDIDEAEWTEEEFSSAVYGASLVHFPKTLKPRKAASVRYNPVSSHSVR